MADTRPCRCSVGFNAVPPPDSPEPVPSARPSPRPRVDKPGDIIWFLRYESRSAVTLSPAVAGGVIYVGAGDYHVYALGAATGAVRWRFLTGCSMRSFPAVVDGVVYIGLDEGHLFALKARPGE